MTWETQPVLRATLADLDMSLVETYLAQRSTRSKLAGRLSNLEEILLNISCATVMKDEAQQNVVRPTNAGMLLFGYDPQLFLIQAEVICILYKDKQPRQRYADRRILRGTITQQIDQAEALCAAIKFGDDNVVADTLIDVCHAALPFPRLHPG